MDFVYLVNEDGDEAELGAVDDVIIGGNWPGNGPGGFCRGQSLQTLLSDIVGSMVQDCVDYVNITIEIRPEEK